MTLLRNSVWSLGAALVPLVAALATIPLYIQVIGPARYGALVLAWTLLGYFGQADFGIGRALTQRIAAAREISAGEIASIVWSGFAAMALLSSVLGGATWLAAERFFASALQADAALKAELAGSLAALALCVPVTALTGAAAGALAGKERFGAASLGHMVGNVAMQVLPLAAAIVWSKDMATLVVASLAARMLGLALMAGLAWRAILMGHWPAPRLAEMRRLVRVGAWMMVASLVAPLMMFADRFVIGALAGALAVAAYTIPFQIAFRTLILPQSLVNALFPRFAGHEEERATRDCGQFSVLVAQGFGIVVIGAICLADPLLRLWLGEDLDPRSIPVAHIVLAGTWCLALASVPWSYIQARGNPRFTALLIVAELPFYLAALWALGRVWGLAGFAAAFTLRGAIDAAILMRAAGLATPAIFGRIAVTGALVAAALACAPYLTDWPSALVAATVLCSAALLLTVRSLAAMPGDVRTAVASLPLVGRLL